MAVFKYMHIYLGSYLYFEHFVYTAHTIGKHCPKGQKKRVVRVTSRKTILGFVTLHFDSYVISVIIVPNMNILGQQQNEVLRAKPTDGRTDGRRTK